jgi:RimJ/RimL family protein N-acetyltransferase
MTINRYGQPVGEPLTAPLPDRPPPAKRRPGHFCEVVPLDVATHLDTLWAEFSSAPDGRDWTYLFDGPFETTDEFRAWLEAAEQHHDQLPFAILHRESRRAVGVASYLRITPSSASIEVGSIHFGRSLQRTAAATEAMYLMMRNAFESGYRRYEWKCDALNAPSRAAAERFGFTYEGTFRQATTYKGRSRDTAWFSIIDTEWPAIRAEFERWLAPSNFDADGIQRTGLDTAEKRLAD